MCEKRRANSQNALAQRIYEYTIETASWSRKTYNVFNTTTTVTAAADPRTRKNGLPGTSPARKHDVFERLNHPSKTPGREPSDRNDGIVCDLHVYQFTVRARGIFFFFVSTTRETLHAPMLTFIFVRVYVRYRNCNV